jgi:hypothetical protein
MKSIGIAVVTAILIGFFAFQASALDIGGAMKGAAKAGGRAAVEKEINKNLKEKNCSFKPKTTELTCDLDDILSTLKTQKSIAEKSGLARDVDVHVNIGEGKDPKNSNLGYERERLIDAKLIKKIGWWDSWSHRVPGDKLEIYVKID